MGNKCVLHLSLQRLFETCYINTYVTSHAWDISINSCRSSCSVRYFCPISAETRMFSQISVKLPDAKFPENSLRGSRDVSCAQIEGVILIAAWFWIRPKLSMIRVKRSYSSFGSLYLHMKERPAPIGWAPEPVCTRRVIFPAPFPYNHSCGRLWLCRLRHLDSYCNT
jgi:hypothetical protein